MGDSTITQILEIDDLGDRIDVLEAMIEEFQKTKIGKGELEIVRVNVVNKSICYT